MPGADVQMPGAVLSASAGALCGAPAPPAPHPHWHSTAGTRHGHPAPTTSIIPMPYRAVFRCIAGCHGEHALAQPIYSCPTCGDLLEVSHDITALRDRSAAGVDAPVRRALQADRVAVRLVGVGQEGMGVPRRPRRAHRLDGRRRHEPAVGGPLRQVARPRRPVGEAVRQLAHRVLQGPRA